MLDAIFDELDNEDITTFTDSDEEFEMDMWQRECENAAEDVEGWDEQPDMCKGCSHADNDFATCNNQCDAYGDSFDNADVTCHAHLTPDSPEWSEPASGW